MLKNYKLIIAVIVGFILGSIFIVILKKYSTFYLQDDVSFEINPLEIFSILINIFLAIYITRNLSKQNELEKTEKELIISYLKEFQIEYNTKIDKLLESENFETPVTNSCFKVLRTKIHSILTMAEENNLIGKDDIISIKIKQKITDAWELFTDTPKIADPNANQATKEGIKTLRLEKISKIESASIEVSRQIFSLAIKINRH